MHEKIIVHISEVNLSLEGGMARVETYWKRAFEKAGYTFLHIGPNEVGAIPHKFFFPYKAYNYYKSLNVKADAFIIHEPASGVFVDRKIPCFLESHGIERRYWDYQLSNHSRNISLKTKITFPIWRLSNCDKGILKTDKLLLINSDDSNYVKNRYLRSEKDIFIFKNGINNLTYCTSPINQVNDFTILFNGSWIERKGKDILIQAAIQLFNQGINIKYLLIGTGKSEIEVISDWPDFLRHNLEVIPTFLQTEEYLYLEKSTIFVLPSFFEGQPLSLLQAMGAGLCCISTNCCGQKDIITNFDNGLLFQPGDYLTLANHIKSCYYNPELYKLIGKRAKNTVTNLSWDFVTTELVNYVTNNI